MQHILNSLDHVANLAALYLFVCFDMPTRGRSGGMDGCVRLWDATKGTGLGGGLKVRTSLGVSVRSRGCEASPSCLIGSALTPPPHPTPIYPVSCVWSYRAITSGSPPLRGSQPTCPSHPAGSHRVVGGPIRALTSAPQDALSVMLQSHFIVFRPLLFCPVFLPHLRARRNSPNLGCGRQALRDGPFSPHAGSY